MPMGECVCQMCRHERLGKGGGRIVIITHQENQERNILPNNGSGKGEVEKVRSDIRAEKSKKVSERRRQ